MSWMELSLHTTHEAVDWVSTLLSSIHYTGEMHVTEYAEPCSSPAQDDFLENWAFTIYLYFPSDRNTQAWIDAIDDVLFPLHRIGLTSLSQSVLLPDKPTSITALQRQTRRVGNHFVILAPNASYSAQTPNDIVLHLGHSLAFGSGLHPATMLSLQLLEQYVTPDMQTLDLGSGTGILSVAMAKLGAQVLALDNDPIAVQATQAEIKRNQVSQQVNVMQGSLGAGSQLGHWMGGDLPTEVQLVTPTNPFDLIVANILARIHITLAPDFRQALCQTSPHRVLITAGFTRDYQEEVSAALAQVGFETIDSAHCDEWVALVHRLKSTP